MDLLNTGYRYLEFTEINFEEVEIEVFFNKLLSVMNISRKFERASSLI